MIIDQITQDLFRPKVLNNAFKHYHEPFINDYLILHCLLVQHNIKSVFEIGCNEGVGTKIIKNALGDSGKVFSLDLPPELAYMSKQHPISEGKGNKIGHKCDVPFTLLLGNSLTYNYSAYPCEAYFVDAEHTEENVFVETIEILKQLPKLIIYHDADMPAVFNGINRAFETTNHYQLYRVTDTRILYALQK